MLSYRSISSAVRDVGRGGLIGADSIWLVLLLAVTDSVGVVIEVERFGAELSRFGELRGRVAYGVAS